MTEPEAEKLLRDASLRVTRPRVAVLSVIHELPHRDAGVILGLVRERLGAVSTQTVYGVLNVLVKARLARRIDLPNSAALYEGRRNDGHQHAVCRRCGRIVDVEVSRPVLPEVPLDEHDFRIDEVDVTYWGVCASCRVDRRTEPAPT